MQTCRVAAASISSRWGQIERNIHKLRIAAEKAAAFDYNDRADRLTVPGTRPRL